MVYADNAATTSLSGRAYSAMLPWLTHQFGNPGSQHSAGQRAHAAVSQARRRIAESLHADPSGVIFTSGGTEADNQAILSAAKLGARMGRRHIVSTQFEHHAVLHALDTLQQNGYEVTLVAPQNDGVVYPDQVREAIRPDTCLVSVMMANNEIGTIQPVDEIGAVCRSAGVLFHTDAVQAAGHIPIDMTASGIDLLSISSHKFHGPMGVGALCARRGLQLSRILEGGGQERGFRPGTENVPGIIGMAEALTECLETLDGQMARLTEMRDCLIREFSALPDASLTGHATRRLPGNVHFTFGDVEAETLLVMLDTRGVCVSAGAACTAGALTQSHVLRSIGLPANRAALRITLDVDNSENDVQQIIQSVCECLSILRP